ncbi:amino acid adenylation domain-containing protein [Limnoraphis robusta]
MEWNQTQQDYPNNLCIHQLFEARVEQTPDAIAVIFKDEQLTYRELNIKANQLASYLQKLGVKSETLVGICVERSFEMIVGILGILKAGGAYVPLDPNYPSERIAYMLDDSQLPVLLTEKKLISSLPHCQVQVICLDSDWEEISKESELPLITCVTPENLAYVIYTSGSTGQPKGVIVPHQAVNRLVLNTNYIYFQSSDVVAFASNFSFDAATFEIWGALLNGASLAVITKDVALSPHNFADQIHSQGITVLFLTTALFNLLAREVPSVFESVQYLLFGGEAVEPKWVKEVLKKGSPQRLLHVYGPTENTTFTTWYLVEDVLEEATTIPIGRPIANTEVYLLDTQLQPVPISVPGEVYIGGDGLAKGYLNRPDLTKEKFIPNPFSNQPSSRLYKTGDLARYLPDGNIEYISRIDNQVKIRGFRIELGEIEAVLARHPNVRSVTVIDREDAPGNKRIVAYLVSNLIPERVPYRSECQLELNGNIITIHTQDISTGGVGLVEMPATEPGKSVRVHLQLPGENELRWLSGSVVWSRPPQAGIRFHLTPSEQAEIDRSVDYQLNTQDLWKTLQRTVTRNLRHYLKQKLPDYMIPSAFVLMKALPLTPNGKVDRRALPTPDNFHSKQEDKFVAPRTPAEAKLAAIWAEILGLKTIGINDNFFELGGHSLQATSLVSKLSAEMNLKVSVKLLFEHPTIAELAVAIEQLPSQIPSFKAEVPIATVDKSAIKFQAPTPDKSSFFQLEQRSLLSLFAVGKLAPVDSAALGYLPLSLIKETSLSRHQILQDWFDNLPMWDAVMETKWGRIAGLTIPIFEDELYSDQNKLVQLVVEALEMAGRLGAKTVSLTGLIPSATDYGRAITQAIEGRNNLPKITTGHATTCSTVVLTIKKILEVSQRSLEQEKVAFIGLGSIGINSLRLMLKCLPHPKSIILCDIYSKQESLQNLQRGLSDDLGFRGSVQIAISSSSSKLPSSIYDTTLIIGATNVPDILDIDRLKPGTLIVDDSGPHCFSPEQAIKRFEKHKDILFTEGGALHAPDPIETVIYLSQLMKKNIDEDLWSDEFKPTNPLNIMGCVMSSLLSSRFDNIKPTVGLPNLETCVQHYQGLERLGFQAADLHCEGYVLPIESNQPSV